MKSSPVLQYSALGGVLAAHALALALLNGMAARPQTVTPPQALRMEMISLAPAEKPAVAPKAAPAPEPVKPQPQAKPAPSKPTVQSKPALQPAKTQADAPAPAKAISAAAAPAAPAPAAEAPKSAGGKADSRDLPVTEPLAHGGYLNNPAPAYPTVSREEGEEGTVRLRVHVSAQGLPQEVSVQSSSGFPRLDRAALAAVKRWRFIPAKRGGEAIAYPFIVPIEFSLKSANT
ncbi:energy transducer TonB [Chromobacterium violaceum]|uniref:energy transducer TonB n=1 Tax=Chromobacterium violaceum TaxID=536 RepID=UPI001BE63751|nr:energy transducer TonB [Chromobacterium violaceum]MBT2869609.1 energy transducer TonB [Chromobacterium violaceum]MCD0493080.1 TonB family protein [Chromobacterium violaceum]